MVRLEQIERIKGLEKKWARILIVLLTVFFTDLLLILFEIRRYYVYGSVNNFTILSVIAGIMLICIIAVFIHRLRLRDQKFLLLNKFYDSE